MKKLFLTMGLTLGVLLTNAQIKVYSGGKAAFGSTSSTPNYNIDVKTGDINVNDAVSNFGYRLGQIMVLQQHNVGSCIFVGPYAGNSNTAIHNTAMGYKAMYTVVSSTATPCSAFGYMALTKNIAYFNDAFGDSALYQNTSGAGNLAVGAWALTNNVTGANNVSVGGRSSEKNTIGGANTVMGWAALYTNTSSNYNTALGFEAVYSGTGGANTGVGYKALFGATSGGYNTAVGNNAGLTVTTGSLSTFVGSGADANAATYTNCASFGYNTVVTATNKIFFGNANVLGCYNAANIWAAQSDMRFKTNVKEDVKGLDFIKKLRPVTYNMDTKKLTEFMTQNMADSIKSKHLDGADFTTSTSRIHSGFLAQEVELAMQKCGFTSTTIVLPPSNSNDPYSLNYVELVVPLVKAVQELSKTADSLATLTNKQDSINKDLQNQINTCCTKTGQRTTNQNNNNGNLVSNGNTLGNNAAKLFQNVPNPFNQTTSIKCFIPDASKTASLLVFDMNGTLKKTIILNGKGEISTTINAKELIAGMYYYSLIIDNTEIDTKKMILTEQ